jgi:hypothetical protein
VKRDQSFPDPAQFKSEKEFNYAALTASVFKKVVQEILLFVEDQRKLGEQLEDKKSDKIQNKFKIGE